MFQTHALVYQPDTQSLFTQIAQLNGSIWLDSAYNSKQTNVHAGRYDLITALPNTTLVVSNNQLQLSNQYCSLPTETQDPFKLIEHIRHQLYGHSAKPSSAIAVPNQMFLPGVMGYVSYFNPHENNESTIQRNVKDEINFPRLAVGFYMWHLLTDHQQKTTTLYYAPEHHSVKELLALFKNKKKETSNTSFFFHTTGNLNSNLSFKTYQDCFENIQHCLRQGDCYQINFAQRFRIPVKGNAFSAYCSIRKATKAPYSAYFNGPNGHILCFSPEKFVSLSNTGLVETQPIKGTIARGKNHQQDLSQLKQLQNSIKNQAENIMIVDLLRNDLGKVCEPGSITVPTLLAPHSYASVHHLVSTIRGQLATQQSPEKLLQACFPGGSVTGAPKIKAMQIIKKLEPHQRHIFCGSLFYIGANEQLLSNIAIRTALWQENWLTLWAGGGIVIDSTAEAEYQETFWKVNLIIEALSGLSQLDI